MAYQISKTTLNFAAKRGLLVEVCESDEHMETDRLWIYTDIEACEPDVSYLINDNGSFTFFDNISLSESVKEELPGTIKDEKHLREVLKFISDNI